MKKTPLKRTPFKKKAKKKKKRKEKTPHQIAEEKADKLWGRLVRMRDDHTCQVCGKPGNQPHHIIYRRYKQTKHDVDNGITLCWAHHRHFAHGDPEKFRDFILDIRGESWYNKKKAKAYATGGDYNPQQNLKELEAYERRTS